MTVRTFLRRARRKIGQLARICVKYVFQMMFFLPVRGNRLLISAYNGHLYGCNPKYISEYLAERDENIEIVWSFVNPKKFTGIPGIKAVKRYSLAWFYYSATASAVISSHAFPREQPKRKGQLFLETWHGGGAYKHVGNGISSAKNWRQRRARRLFVQKIDLFVSSCQAFTQHNIRQDYGYGGEVLPCGMPRNDMLFDREKREDARRRVREKLGISGCAALYAPTFRGIKWKGYRAVDTIPYQAVLSALRQRFGGTAVILKRAHPGGEMADGTEQGVLDVTDYPDMQELLCAADLLITDYSSSIWDYALLGRPCLLYIPDLDEYIAQRGLCTPAEEWPGIVCRSEEALLEAIRSLDEAECAGRAERHLRAFGSYETGTATRQICERIWEHMREKQQGPGKNPV